MPLEKSVSLQQAIFYGLGVIFGAGIYSLIGSTAGIIGNLLWLSFLIASLVAALTAFSYAELISYFPKVAAESVFVKKAFGKEFLSFFIGFVVLITILFSVSTVAWGFTSYFKLFSNLPLLLVAILIIIFCSIINFLGIQESVNLNYLLTIIGGGLLLIIFFGIPFIGSVDLLQGPENVFGIGLFSAFFSSIALIFFAYIGFEGIANISEEVTTARTTVPKAIIISLVIATIIYVLIAIISVSVVPPPELALATTSTDLSAGPLALVAERAIMPGFGFWLSLAALFATASTILLLLVVSSRLLYGLANLGFLPKIFSKTHSRTKTPYYSIIFVGLLSIMFLFIGNIEVLGNLTTMGTFLMFFSVNASLIAIRLKENPKKLNFISPINIGKLPILALIGSIFCIIMFFTQYWQTIIFFNIKIPLFFFGIICFSASIPLYLFFKKSKKNILKKWPK